MNKKKLTSTQEFLKMEWEFLLKEVPKKIESKKSWHNGTGYLDGIMQEDIEGPVRFQMAAPDSRRGVIFTIGNMRVAIFERYTDFEDAALVAHLSPTKDFDRADYKQQEMEDVLETVFRSGALNDRALAIANKVISHKSYRLKKAPSKEKVLIKGTKKKLGLFAR